jgi:hypothetical protein
MKLQFSRSQTQFGSLPIDGELRPPNVALTPSDLLSRLSINGRRGLSLLDIKATQAIIPASVGEFAMRTSFRLAAITLISLSAAVGATQQNFGSTIVVKGTRIDPEQARVRAVEFVKRTGVATGQKQVARWVVPVCIKAIGLTASQEARVVDLMLAVAREARIPVAKVDCKPNLTVTFAADAGEVVRKIHKRKPNQLRELSLPEKERVLTGDAPVRWWYATTMLERDGMEENSLSAGWIGNGAMSSGEGVMPVGLPIFDGVTSTQQYNSGSNVRTPTVRSIYGATVVVDATKAGDTSIDAIAAYAAMVAFAEMDASDPPPPDSILGLFQPDRAESALTDWDMAFLKSLYRMPLDRRARIQRGHLVEALLDERLPDKEEKKNP